PVAAGPATARCLIVVTPDAQRSMNTFLGACADLSVAHLDSALLAAAKVVYLEGYLWDRPTAKAAFLEACQLTHAAGGKIALSLSDPFCVDRHRESFRALIADEVDILFANTDELTALHETDDLEAAIAATREWVDIAAVTRGADGAVIVAGDTRAEIAAQPVPRVIDTTGAGDLFAAGFLRAYTQNLDLATCGRYGAIAAAEVISHFGARPESDLAELVAAAPAA
ncbi:MAG: adenosine kinase, partial [Pseudomonadota bacterium]|nr:adenosine kinase [Pseudomonadota bacterium]